MTKRYQALARWGRLRQAFAAARALRHRHLRRHALVRYRRSRHTIVSRGAREGIRTQASPKCGYVASPANLGITLARQAPPAQCAKDSALGTWPGYGVAMCGVRVLAVAGPFTAVRPQPLVCESPIPDDAFRRSARSTANVCAIPPPSRRRRRRLPLACRDGDPGDCKRAARSHPPPESCCQLVRAV